MQERIQAGTDNIAIIVKEISTTEEEPPTLHWNKRKGVLKAKSQPSEAPSRASSRTWLCSSYCTSIRGMKDTRLSRSLRLALTF